MGRRVTGNCHARC